MRYLAALTALTATGAFVGYVANRDATFDSAYQPLPEGQCSEARRGEAVGSSELRLDGTGVYITGNVKVRLSIPADWWEVRAIVKNASASEYPETADLARRCLERLGMTEPPTDVVIENAKASLAHVDAVQIDESEDEIGPWKWIQDGRDLTLTSEPLVEALDGQTAGEPDPPVVSWTLGLEQQGIERLAVAPVPTRLDGTSSNWTFDSDDGQQVRVSYRMDSWKARVLELTSWENLRRYSVGPVGVTIYFGSFVWARLSEWLLLLVAIAIASRRRTEDRVSVLALFGLAWLFASLSVGLSIPEEWLAGLVPLGLLVLMVGLSTRGWILGWSVLSIAVAGGSILAIGPRSNRLPFAYPLVVVLGGILTCFVTVLIIATYNTALRPLSERQRTDASLTPPVVALTGLLALAFGYGIGHRVRWATREDAGDFLGGVVAELPLTYLAALALPVVIVSMLALASSSGTATNQAYPESGTQRLSMCVAYSAALGLDQIALGDAVLPVWALVSVPLLFIITTERVDPRKLVVGKGGYAHKIDGGGLLLRGRRWTRLQASHDSGEVYRRDRLLTAALNPLSADLHPGEVLLARGPGGDWSRNGVSAMKLGMWISIVPVAYLLFTWLSVRLQSPLTEDTALDLVSALATEIARWLAVSFIFGCFYACLPGRIGPVKALSMAVVSLGSFLVAWSWSGLLDTAIESASTFRIVQLFFFLAVLAVVYDWQTIRAAGGSVGDLRNTYSRGNSRVLFVALAPLGVTGLALIQQLIVGSGADFVRSIIESAIRQGIAPPSGP